MSNNTHNVTLTVPKISKEENKDEHEGKYLCFNIYQKTNQLMSLLLKDYQKL